MQESGLSETTPLIYALAVWGQRPVLSHPEFPPGAPLGVPAVIWWHILCLMMWQATFSTHTCRTSFHVRVEYSWAVGGRTAERWHWRPEEPTEGHRAGGEKQRGRRPTTLSAPQSYCLRPRQRPPDAWYSYINKTWFILYLFKCEQSYFHATKCNL